MISVHEAPVRLLVQYIMCDHIGIEDKSANSTFHLVSKQGSPTAIHDFAPEPKFQGVINHRYIIFANRKVHVLHFPLW